MAHIIEMKPGRIYHIDYGGTELIVRYKGNSTCNYMLFDYLHYWQGYENFHSGENQYCVKSGVKLIREATVCEKQTLVRYEIANDCI